MNGLIKRLEKIKSECEDPALKRKAAEKDENIDEFTSLKRKFAADVKQLRKMIKERDELEAVNPGSTHTVEASHNIRKTMKEIRADAQTLSALQKREEDKFRKKNKADSTEEQKIESRAEIVDLAFKHIKECELLSNRRFGDISSFGERDARDPVITELPDIDDEGFQLLRKNDAAIDMALDGISNQVGVLKEMAVEMGKEAELHGVMLDELNIHVDKVNDQLENINIRLKKTLDSIRKGDRFIVDIILLCVLLGVGGYIYHMIKS